MTARQTLLIAFLGSGLLLAGAYAFQHLGGMPPCQMCLWQRYPHGIAFAVGALALTVRHKGLLVMGALAAATTSGIGFYHVGVEKGWWQGPTSCSAGAIDGISADALLDQILTAPLVRCDEIPWQMFGLSMAGWNAVISLALVGFWLMALRRA